MKEWIIVGLGNPDNEYKDTRHNVGRAVLDALCQKNYFSSWDVNGIARGLQAKGVIAGEPVIALKPETYMNLSGESVRFFVKTSEEADRLVVVHDDLDLPIGRIKVSVDSGSGGHHGVESIIAHTATKGFVRVRVGICPIDEMGVMRKVSNPDFVIERFSLQEEEIIKDSIARSVGAIEKIVVCGVEEAMNVFNTFGEKKE